MRFLARSLTGLFLAALTVGLLAYAASLMVAAVAERAASGGGPPVARERVVAANVLTLTPQTLTPQIEAYGQITSRRRLELRSARGGRVTLLAPGFGNGAEVTAGQVLVQLDRTDATAARDLAAATVAEAGAEGRDAARALGLAQDDLAAAQAQVDLRRQALERQNGLQARNLGSPAAVETAALALSSADQAVLSRRAALAQAQTRVDLAASSLQRAEIALDEAVRALADTTVTAPFDGRLNEVAVVEGGLVTANERLAEIIDADTLDVAFRLSTAQFQRLLASDGTVMLAPVQVRLDAMGAVLTATGKVERVGAATEAGVAGRMVYAGLMPPTRGLAPGDFVTVMVDEPALSGTALLPATALDDAGMVLVLGPEDRLTEAAVRVLRRQGDGVIVEVGPLEGREIVAERTPFLGAGIKIRPVRSGGDADKAEAAPASSGPAVPEPALLETDSRQTVALTPERRAELIALVRANARLSPQAREAMLDQLAQDRVPLRVVERLTARRGG